jgi:hypothetical protein
MQIFFKGTLNFETVSKNKFQTVKFEGEKTEKDIEK